MEARIKDTGELIDVYYSSNGNFWVNRDERHEYKYLQNEQIFVENRFDWEQFRNETAAKILSGMCANGENSVDNMTIDGVCRSSVFFTDKLIEELRKPIPY